MNLKRLIAVGSAAALMLSATAIPALATVDGDGGSFTLIKNWAWVKNVVNTSADTGGNVIAAEDDVDGGSISTGVATAWSGVSNIVNTNDVEACPCEEDGTLIIKNKAKVKNYVTTSANTGWNVIAAGDDVTGGSIYTGDANAGSLVENVVNTNIVGTGI